MKAKTSKRAEKTIVVFDYMKYRHFSFAIFLLFVLFVLYMEGLGSLFWLSSGALLLGYFSIKDVVYKIELSEKRITFYYFNGEQEKYEFGTQEKVEIIYSSLYVASDNELKIFSNERIKRVKFIGGHKVATQLTNELIHCGVNVLNPYVCD